MNDQTRTAAAVDTLLALKREFLMPCVFHFYRKPMELVRGEDSRVFDTTGKAYVDCYAGVGVTNCGHAEPGIVARAAAQLGTLAHTTFGGNPVCATAGLASLDFMREHRLEDVAARGGARLRAGLEALATRHACIREVRGLGLMLGVELVAPTGEPAGALLDDLLEALKDEGILAGKTGPHRNVLTLMPPLVITDAEIDQVLATLDAALATTTTARQQQPPPGGQATAAGVAAGAQSKRPK